MSLLSAVPPESGSFTGIVIVILVIFLLIGGLIVLLYFKTWLQALLSGAPVSMISLIGMTLRKVPRQVIVENRIAAIKSGIELSTDKLEAHYLAGGRVGKVVRAIIAANKAGIRLSFEKATAIDLAGRDVEEAVHTSVLPKVIDVPDA